MHEHMLVREPGEKCCVVSGASKCRHQGPIEQVWKCKKCDFYLCETCMKIDVFLKVDKLGTEEINNLRNKFISKFCEFSENKVIGTLLKLVKLTTSVAHESPKTLEILKQTTNPYYMRTLLETLQVIQSEHNKLTLLGIIEDLVKLKLPLDVDQGSYQLLRTDYHFA
jgi:hypothetical protein